MKNLEKALELYEKFNQGIAWLNKRKRQNKDITQDNIRFDEVVVNPLEETIKLLSSPAKDVFDKITNAISVFEGTIISGEVKGVRFRFDEDKNCLVREEKIEVKEKEDSHLCPRCGEVGERYCLGHTGNEKYDYGLFCLKCEPYNE